jgi:hypothetical protein
MAGLSGLPQHLQMKVLSMLDDGAFDKVVQGATAHAPESARAAPVRAPDTTFLRPVSTPFHGQRAIVDIKARGLAVFDNFLGQSAAEGIRTAAMDIAARGLMRRARMGKDGTQWADARARGDSMIWVNDLAAMLEGLQADRTCAGAPDIDGVSENAMADGRCAQEAAAAIEEIGRAVDKLKAAGEEICCAIGGQFECSKMTFQLAHYSDGARYVRHSDVGPQTADRRLTCIYYLNPNWQRQDGGELRLYLPSGSGRAGSGKVQYFDPCDVAPRMDRLIIFRSEIEHEVLPSMASRLALSGWIYSPVSIESCFPELLLREMPDLDMPENAALVGMGPNATSTFCRLRSTQWSLSGGCSRASSSSESAKDGHGSLTDALGGLCVVSGADVTPPASTPPSNRRSDPNQGECSRMHGNGKIFVSVVAYRDPECPGTIADLFAKAMHPGKLFVGLITQCDPEADDECLLENYQAYIKKSGAVQSERTIKKYNDNNIKIIMYGM